MMSEEAGRTQRCPNCSECILKTCNDGRRKLYAKVVVWDADGACKGACTKCGQMVDIPLVIEDRAKKRRKISHIVLKDKNTH